MSKVTELTKCTMYESVNLFIDGVWSESENRRRINVINPADEEIIGTVAYADRADLERAARSAIKGFVAWRQVSAWERCQILRTASQLLRERSERIAELLTREQGKPLREARAEILFAADVSDWFAEEGRRVYSYIIPARNYDVQQTAFKEPIGPVAAFTPWNFPIGQIVRKLSCALAAGCSIIVKAPEETPAAPAELIRAFSDAGVPAGVINLVFGNPAEISEYLIPHSGIRKISFTGSTVIGKRLASLAGAHMKRITMELGGHAPVIIFEDANIEQAGRLLCTAKFRNAGQVCTSPTRILVHQSKFSQFVDCFVREASSLKVGNGLDASSDMGPLANARRVTAVEAMVDDAKRKGAEAVLGGQRIGNRGYFFQPTIMVNVPTDARMMNEEPFGPLAMINQFETFEEAVSEANRLPYGLASYAYTQSAETAQRIAKAVEAGMMSINHHALGLPETPFGGIKDSGFGTEGGQEAIADYAQTKFVTQAGLG